MPSALVVEDNDMVVYLHEVLLEVNGFTITIARNGQQAVDIVSSGKEFDVILMNKHMPVMDGVAATKMLRSMNVKSLIVGVTVADEAERQVFLEAGLDECFFAPLNRAKVHKVLDLLKNVSSTD